jgi:Glu-tRNA(Gln) amidotransferase subunit E-like FAD-binding protein
MKGAGGNDGLSAIDPPRVPSEAEVDALVSRGSEKLTSLKLHNPAKRAHVLMGLVMPELRGSAEGAAVADKVRKVLEERS